jgi:hypothetical protein
LWTLSTAPDVLATDCAVKFWAPNLEKIAEGGIFFIPEKLDDSIYDEEPTLDTPDCQDGLASHYDKHLPPHVRDTVASLLSPFVSGDVCIPSGTELCHLICEVGCGMTYMDPTQYLLAAQVECSSPVLVIRT